MNDKTSVWAEVLDDLEEPSAQLLQPTAEQLQRVGEHVGFSSRQKTQPMPGVPRKRGRPRSTKVQFNHRITPQGLAVFEAICDQLPQVEKGEILERAINTLAREVGPR